MGAPASIGDLETVLRSPKTLEGLLAWRNQHKGSGERHRTARVNIVAALSAGGVTLEGVRFLAATSVFEPERRVSAQLAAFYGGKFRPFTRIDWRDKPHTNRLNPSSDLWMRNLGETHVHRLSDNAFLGWPDIIAGSEDLPLANEAPELEDFGELMDYVSKEFSIDNAREIGEPPWQAWL